MQRIITAIMLLAARNEKACAELDDYLALEGARPPTSTMGMLIAIIEPDPIALDRLRTAAADLRS